MVKKIYPDTKLIVFKAIYDKNKTDIVKNVNELLVGSKADLVIVNDYGHGLLTKKIPNSEKCITEINTIKIINHYYII